MMSLLIKLLVRNKENVTSPSVKKAYASLSSTVGIFLNLLLCTAKIGIGLFSNSVAISADGFNNLSDAGTSLVSLVGFKIAGYGSGTTHPFGHGRIEWIMGIFTSIAVLVMGIELVDTSVHAIINPEKSLFGAPVVIVLTLSILIKGYMYLYNRRFARITDSETLKATAADCISDSAATFAVLISTVLSHITGWEIDGYCGVLVSIFIMFAGVKSLWEVLGRIMGKAADQGTLDEMLGNVNKHKEIVAVQNVMLHDYGFGYYVISMRVEGYKKDSRQLYASINKISYDLYKKFHCDCFIQIDYLIDDDVLTKRLFEKALLVLHEISDEMSIRNFRLIDGGAHINIMIEIIYPANKQKMEEETFQAVEKALEAEGPGYHTTIKGVIRRERISLNR